jgi:Nitrogen regulatory protein PII
MKEIMAFIRPNMVNATKKALADGGYPSFSCRKCLGRGKHRVDQNVIETIVQTGSLPTNAVGESLTEMQRLIAKRFFLIIVNDSQVKEVVDILIGTNQTGNPGDGKIFILPLLEAYTVRTGEATEDSF